MNLRVSLSVLACKLARGLLRLLRRGGTALPGKVALRICPTVLAELSKDVKTVIVTGTNGKTTTCGMLAGVFRALGLSCLANRSGANLLSGITAEFAANADWRGRPRSDYAVIECDEAALKLVAPLIRPRAIVVTNLFRDQLDRYGEVLHTLRAVLEGVRKAPDAVLCLNADCSLTSSIAQDVPNRIVYFGLNVSPGTGDGSEPSDAPRCLRCGAAYEYEYRTFGHLGGFYCPKCSWRRPEADVAVTRIRSCAPASSEIDMEVNGGRFEVKIGLPGAYNIYNAVAAVAGAVAMGFEPEPAVKSLAVARSCFGRMEAFRLGNADVRVILVKNPAGCNQALAYLAGLESDFLPVFCLNDRIADGRDVSWIWDADFERLNLTGNGRKILVTGDRAEDMRLRLKYAGADEGSILLIRSTAELLRHIGESRVPVFVLPNYTAMLTLRRSLSRVCGEKDFWE